MSNPLILTLRLDAATETLLTTLRTHYFPRSRNHLNSHITLFHALPCTSGLLVTRSLTHLSSHTSTFPVRIASPFPLAKKGVALSISSSKLLRLHENLLELWRRERVHLTRQDDARLRPHVTVQNKVAQEEARRCLLEVKAMWEDRRALAVGMGLWRYEDGGEWTHLKDFGFQREERAGVEGSEEIDVT